MNKLENFVLVTPAKNEGAYIEATIDSVVQQSIIPAEWIIVDDGSVDNTLDLAGKAAALHPWIRVVTRPAASHRDFAAVVDAFEEGIRQLQTADYDFIGLLDSDVRLPTNYYERVIEYFREHENLGLAGGIVVDVGESKSKIPVNRTDIPGAVQFFRRTCFEGIGRMVAIPEGGWDALTCAQVRMLGYESRLLTDLVVDHLKPRNATEGNRLRRSYHMGVRDYALGYHPVFELIKCLSRVFETPFLIGSVLWWTGYCASAARRRPRCIPPNLLRFVHTEQMARLRCLQPFSRAKNDSGRVGG